MNSKMLVVLAALPMSLAAHHSGIGRYDAGNIMEIEGEVVRVQWQNPHVYLSVKVENTDGQPEIWQLESGSPVRLQRAGISRESIKVGDHIRAAGDSPLTDEREIFVSNILPPSGEELLMRPNISPRWASAAAGDYWFRFATEGDTSRPELGLFRTWATTTADPRLFYRTPSPADLADRYPLSEAGLRSFQQFNPATDNPTRNCSPKGMPKIMDQPHPMEIVQLGDTIQIRLEEYDMVRTVYMNQEGAPRDRRPSLLGYSVGRWDGDTLVVTTTGVSYPWVSQLGIPQSEASTLVERFSAVEDGSRLHYELTVNDTTNFTEPFTVDKDFLYLPGIQVEPYECTENE